MNFLKLVGFNRIYQAGCFTDEVNDMFGKGSGEKVRYFRWLYTWLRVLDNDGLAALAYEQFEYIRGTNDPRLYAIRHPRSKINERYLYVYIEDEAAILLTAFKEKSAVDYQRHIERAVRIYRELERGENEYQG